MGIHLTEKPLEERLSQVDEETLTALKKALINRQEKQERGGYLKLDVAENIVSYFRERGLSFGESGAESEQYLLGMTKEPLKAVERGQKVRNIPSKFLAHLDDFEKIYFLAGMHALFMTPEEVGEMTPLEIVSTYLRAGINKMAEMHNKYVPTEEQDIFLRRGNRIVQYTNRWTPPHADTIKRRLLSRDQVRYNVSQRYRGVIKQFGYAFTAEGDLLRKASRVQRTLFDEDPLKAREDLEKLQERTAIRLDSLAFSERSALTRLFGSKRLGDYSVRDKNLN